MFEQLIESSSRKRQDRRRWFYFGATAALWVPGMMAAVLGGVIAYDGRLSAQYPQPEKLVLLYPSIPYDGPAPTNNPDKRPTTQPGALTAQTETPRKIPDTSNMPQLDIAVGSGIGPSNGPAGTGGDPNGDPNGTLNGVPGAPPGGAAPPPEPTPQPLPKKEEPTPAAATKPRVSVMLQGTAVKRVEPAYPRLCRDIHVSGPVVVEVIVDETGKVARVRALSGHPLLRKAAEDAARDWRWNPSRLNGAPVQVIGTIIFNFVL